MRTYFSGFYELLFTRMDRVTYVRWRVGALSVPSFEDPYTRPPICSSRRAATYG